MTLAAVPADWSAPWLAPYRALGEPIEARVRAGAGVAEALNRALADRPVVLAAGELRFAPQSALPPGVAYEAHIHRTAQVPTRDGWHDLFNGLVWLHQPALKQALNERHALALAREGIGPRRGAERDRLTLFDENALLLQAPPALADALQRRAWDELFITRRAEWARASVWPVGHALLEKLLQPRKAITAHVWVLPAGVDPEAWLRSPQALERLLDGPRAVLPVLGIPGWCTANQDPAYYRDAAVFRPPSAPVRGCPPNGPGAAGR